MLTSSRQNTCAWGKNPNFAQSKRGNATARTHSERDGLPKKDTCASSIPHSTLAERYPTGTAAVHHSKTGTSKTGKRAQADAVLCPTFCPFSLSQHFLPEANGRTVRKSREGEREIRCDDVLRHENDWKREMPEQKRNIARGTRKRRRRSTTERISLHATNTKSQFFSPPPPKREGGRRKIKRRADGTKSCGAKEC